MENTENKPVSIGNWLVTFILLAIPFVNIVMVILWVCGVGGQPSKSNFFRAYLIFLVIIVGIAAAFVFSGAGQNYKDNFSRSFQQALKQQQQQLASPSPSPAQ
ncbi:MAG TPA: hypothetical protein VG733_08570 [Chthoniobacteraceae bacterium]|nr:hypothetical protein [Chthoniobacteraceae bacterium]